MCRSTVEGGRRCALHSPGGFISTRLSRMTSGLDARQVNAGFHVLRSEGENAPAPTIEQWAQWLQDQATTLEGQQAHGRTMNAMRNYIVNAANDIPDGPTFYAMNHLRERSEQQGAALEQTLRRISLANQTSLTATRRAFNALRSQASVSSESMPSGYSPTAFRRARAAGLPLDTPTVHALGTLNDLGDQAARAAEPRITHQAVDSNVISTAGYDPEADRRLEIRFFNADGTQSEHVHAYRNVPQNVWREFQNDPIGTFNSQIRGNSEYLYSSLGEAERDGVRRRCPSCGQFAAMSHSCPNTDGSQPRRRIRGEGRRRATPNTDQVSRMNRAQERLETQEGQETVASIETPNTPYTLEDLQRHITTLQERQAAGEEVLQYATEDVTGGLCSPDGGMGFGVEIEFMIDDSSQLYDISTALHEAGLTQNDRVSGYHAGRESNWRSWSLEEDCTVGAELVSPIMHDTPEDWEQLRQVCEIIKSHGGYVSEQTGGHVHISSEKLGTSVAKHAELVNTINEHEDVMYRIGTEPGGTHRTTYWCAPNQDAGTAYRPTWGRMAVRDEDKIQMDHYTRTHGGHNTALNLADSGQGSSSHVEFRAYDGSLDPAVIQTRVLVSAALVNKASQHSGAEPTWNSPTTQRPRKRIGHHNMLPDEQQHDGFLDFQTQLFSREEDRLRITSLYGVTRWQHNLPDYDASDEDDYDYDDDDY